MLKEKLKECKNYIMLGILVIICLYFYITKIYSPAYKELKEKKAKLSVITIELDGMGSKDDLEDSNSEAERELEIAELDAENVEFKLNDIISKRKSQSIDSAMNILVEVNKLSLSNRVQVDSVVLSNKELNRKKDEAPEGEDKEEEQIEQDAEAATEGEEDGDNIASEKLDPLNSFDWEIYDIHFQGNYNNATNFVESLRNTSKIVRVDYVDLIYTGQDDNYAVFIKKYI